MVSKYDIAMRELFKEKQLFANFLLNSVVMFVPADHKQVQTAAVGFRNRRITFFFNLGFMDTLSVTEVRGIIEHECLHLLFEHLKYNYRRKSRVDHKVWNIAEDCALNQYIKWEYLPADVILPELLEKKLSTTLERMQTSEYYYEKMKEHRDKLVDINTLDQHGVGDDDSDFLDGMGSKMTDDEKQAAIQNMVSKSEKQAKNTDAGTISSEIQQLIDKVLSNKVNYKQILRNMIGKSISNTRKLTKNRLNRRYGNLVPGVKKSRTVTIAVITDSSGSVSDESYGKFLSEIDNGRKATQGDLYHIQADSEVKKVKKYRRGEKIKYERSGYGGTAYQPAIDKAMELGVDIIFYCGDMDSADQPKDPGVPFVWVTVGGAKPPGSFGTIVSLDDL